MTTSPERYVYKNLHTGGEGVRTRKEIATLLSHSRFLYITWTDEYNKHHTLNYNTHDCVSVDGDCVTSQPRSHETSVSFCIRILGNCCPYTCRLFLGSKDQIRN